MRCAKRTAASRCTWVWCCKSSTAFTRSARAAFRPAKGSRERGAPALAASRCHPMASPTLMRGASRKASPLAAHSTIKASWPLLRRNSSSFSRSTLAAPLSRWLISSKTACSCSNVGWPASQSRRRAVRSAAVETVNAPPVKVSRAARSRGLLEESVTSRAHSKLGAIVAEALKFWPTPYL